MSETKRWHTKWAECEINHGVDCPNGGRACDHCGFTPEVSRLRLDNLKAHGNINWKRALRVAKDFPGDNSQFYRKEEPAYHRPAVIPIQGRDTLEGGDWIDYPSISAASKETGISEKAIKNAALGRTNGRLGFQFRFKEVSAG